MFRRLLRKFCWHKWKPVYKETHSTFLGERCSFYRKAFRVCERCGKAQEYNKCFVSIDAPPGYQWIDLTDCEAEILMRKVINKGDYFILKEIISI